MSKRTWSRNEKWTAGGVLVAVIGIVLGLFAPGKPTIRQNTKTNIVGTNNVAGNNITGNGNVVGNNNTIIMPGSKNTNSTSITEDLSARAHDQVKGAVAHPEPQSAESIRENVVQTEPAHVAEQPAFSVDIENRIFVSPGPNGTGFWFGSFLPTGCALEPIQAAIFLRIVNLQDHKEMITAYSAKLGNVPLLRVQVPRGRIFLIYGKGQLPSGGTLRPGASLDIGSPEGLGSPLSFPIKDVDPSVAMPLTGDFLDNKLGENSYLQPYEPVRGWTFFRYPKNTFTTPAHLTMSITDALQRTFSYPLPDHPGDPGGDTLSRKLIPASTENLAGCTIAN